jgi:hypothetical protein
MGTGAYSAAVEQVARHVHSSEAVSLMKHVTLYAAKIAPLAGRDRGRGVPTER